MYFVLGVTQGLVAVLYGRIVGLAPDNLIWWDHFAIWFFGFFGVLNIAIAIYKISTDQ
jgi:hypothetical protein